MTKLTVTTLTLPAAVLEPDNPLPVFRDPQPDRPVTTDGTIPPEKLEQLGTQTGRRVLPYGMQDQYTRERTLTNFQAVVLENQFLRATFLPELGGRLVSLFDYAHDRELLFFNPVFQPANLAIRNAWFAGGIEWNIGQFGHTFLTCSPVFAAEIPGLDGEPGLRLYEYERCKSLFWQIDFYLPEGSPALIAFTRVVNPNAEPVPMYWWTNIAVPELKGQRVLAPAKKAIFMHAPGSGNGFGYSDLPKLPSLKGRDGTYSLNYPFANEFFFQCDQAEMPWEAALGPDGYGLVEASTARLRYRKMFCWGDHPGGRHWQSFLSQPGMAYLEIQAGLAPTQLHGLVMPGKTAWDWTEVFGALQVDPSVAHHADWETASGLDGEIKDQLAIPDLMQIEGQTRSLADLPARHILAHGSGWGALELIRKKNTPSQPPPFSKNENGGGADQLPAFTKGEIGGGEVFPSPKIPYAGFWGRPGGGETAFPATTLAEEQYKWLALLEQGALPEQSPDDPPGEWMVQEEWEQLLEQSLKAGKSDHWLAWLHLGVMRLERFDEAGARLAWETSLERTPNAWAWRNLAVLALRVGDQGRALECYKEAWEMMDDNQKGGLRALAAEYLHELIKAGRFGPAQEVYNQLPQDIQQIDRVQILLAKILLETGDYDRLEKVLNEEYAVVQEGESGLTDIWFDMWSLRKFGVRWEKLRHGARRQMEWIYPPPEAIDFRMAS